MSSPQFDTQVTKAAATTAPSRTLVFQTFRTTDVPRYIEKCLDSVQRWAASQGFAYEFHDNSFLDRFPSDLPQNNHICVKTDLIRLHYAASVIEGGTYDRAIWCDADLLIFDLDFNIPDRDFLLCREQFVHPLRKTFGLKVYLGHRVLNLLGKFHQGLRPIRKTVNNSVLSCNRNGLDVIQMLSAVTEATIRRSPQLGKLDAGTVVFSYLKEFFPFELIEEVALICRSDHRSETVNTILKGGFKAANVSNSSSQNQDQFQLLCEELIAAWTVHHASSNL